MRQLKSFLAATAAMALGVSSGLRLGDESPRRIRPRQKEFREAETLPASAEDLLGKSHGKGMSKRSRRRKRGAA